MVNNKRILVEISEESFFELLEQYFREKYNPVNNASNSANINQSWLSHAEASAYIKVPEKTLYQLTHKKIIKYFKSGRKNVYRVEDLDNYLLNNEAAAEPFTHNNFSSLLKNKKNGN